MASEKNEYIPSYMTFRKCVGWVALALRIAVWVASSLFEGIPMQDSVGAYYYTSLRDVFVGCLCAVGVFLFLYRGVERFDAVLAHIAGASVLGIALLPMTQLTIPASCSDFQRSTPRSVTSTADPSRSTSTRAWSSLRRSPTWRSSGFH